MGKQYYCDYCERSFADGAENRKKHLASVHHQKLRLAHYELYKDAASILEENKFKKPCRKFHSTGHCEFELSCKYSHLTALDVLNLEERARQENSKYISSNPCPEPDIESWLKTQKIQINSSVENVSSTACIEQNTLPDILRNAHNLPVSLIPAKMHEHLHISSEPQWG